MRFLLTVLLLAVGASGQHTGVIHGLEPNNASACCYRMNENGMLEKIEPSSSIDVPAIERKVLWHRKGECWENAMSGVCATNDIYKSVPTCADKTRILEHDEQDPPKYWCRKVQP